MQVTDGSGSTSFTYTSLGRVASRTQVMGSISKAVGYGYNGAGQLTTLTTPSGQTITYGYDENRISSVTVNSTVVADDVLYDPFGPVRQWDWGNATLAVRTFDQDGNVDQIDSAGLKTYAQDDAFRITGVTDAVNSNLSWSLGYDLNDRLTSASKTGQSQSFTYDANGNRLTQGGSSSSTYTISSTSNRLSSVSGALSRTYGYDAAGNTTSYGGFTFGYNDAGRLTSVSGSASASYQQNALGQRVKKTVSGVSTYFVYDEAGHLVGEYDGSGNLIQETVWLEEVPIATLRPNGGSVSIFYVHTDHLNTPRRISRPSDNVILWRWDSDPFGTDAANQDPDGDSTTFAFNLRFPGQYFDAETGLSYNYFRDYDPQIGRYVESDPIGLAGGIGTYSYARVNPIRWLDAFGLSAADVEAVRTHVSTHFPDIHPQGGWTFYDPPPGSDAQTEPISGKILLNRKYAKECLTLEEFRELYADVLHESMHSSDGGLQRMFDNYVEHLTGDESYNHKGIRNRESWEMGWTPQYGKGNRIPTWPMWGIPYDPNLNRPIVSPLVNQLYEESRSCRCQQ